MHFILIVIFIFIELNCFAQEDGTICNQKEITDFSYSKKALAINACGGIFSGDDVIEALNAGATTVQLYTSFVYQGPCIVRSMNKHLIKFMNLNLETIIKTY